MAKTESGVSGVTEKAVTKGNDNIKQGDKSSLAPGGGLAAHELRSGHLIGDMLVKLMNNF